VAAGCLPDKLKLIVVTHGDFDHVGNCAKLQQKYKSRIAIHKEDSQLVEHGVLLKQKVRTLTASSDE
jgi:glyoxylase-like metal-dependent hydrolase (beta-lactamase superfamily II)